ncbi:MAG: class I SAM-dependent methyltransferase [Peptococcaceae bacterium]|nr:class I SAM-dependent methyltransferase [Peptococcaceae bacterium]
MNHDFILPDGLSLQRDENGLALYSDDQVLRGDFVKMIPRLKHHNLTQELLVKAAKIKDAGHSLRAVDATAGLGDDSILLAAAGFDVQMYERNPVIHALLADAIERAKAIPELAETVSRMHLHYSDSMEAMKQLHNAPELAPDVILLDPMFPARQKNALVKKKLQMIQKLEFPCVDEKELLLIAMEAAPKKLIVKRPPKGPHLADVKPDYTTEGKAVRFDCFVNPKDRIEKFRIALL